MESQKKQNDKTTLTILKTTYSELLRMKNKLSTDEGKNISWDNFFSKIKIK